MSEEEIVALVLDEAREKMAKAVTHARHEFATIRTGRAAPALIEKLVVDYYGSEVPLQQMANISVPEARMLVVSPYDKGSVPAVEKAIRHSDLGLNPSTDGTVIRLTFPPLTGDRRKELVRMVKQMAEDNRVSVRNVRRTARSELESMTKDGELSEDDLARAEKDIDGLTRATEAQIDEALAQKETELLED
ncbi:MAG TPA: ribosome recycling factor [Acidimicrobiales bacterium]|nr:ribosome recycling factor [Acidimicrobiales bacterium]